MLGALHVYSVHYVCSVHYVYSVHSVRSVHSVHLVRAVTDRGLPSFCTLQKNPHVWLTFHQVQHPLRLPHKTTLERPKVVRASGAFTILTWTCALRQNGGTFSTSQLPKVLRQWCFVRLEFEMCFAPQPRALFRHLNLQKWSKTASF